MSEETHFEPRWRRDFPIDWDADRSLTRRELARFLLLSSSVICGGSALLALAPPASTPAGPRIRVASVEDLPVGGVKLFRYPDSHSPAILIRTSRDHFLSYGQRCTHLSCPVLY
ncbi:MAG: ubiquinol-cytochrome c reductase iron-sulfur subunit, partial [Capsulimonadaceae bacterium]